jgi:hypothetical protein
VTYGCTLILRASSASMEPGHFDKPDSTLIAPLRYHTAARGPWERADRLRLAAPALAPAASRVTLASADAWLGLGKELHILAICGECHIGEFPKPLNAATVRVIAVGPHTFDAMQAGRDFTPTDTMGGKRVAIINRSAYRAMYPGGYPTGHVFRTGHDDEYSVVGLLSFEPPPIFGNSGPIPLVFVPIFQHPPAEPEVTAPASGWDGVRARVAAMPADAPSFGNPRPLAARMDEFIQPLGWFSALFAGLAGSATGIAAYSLVAVMIQMVTLRERDIAIRIAVGAERKHIERWVVARTTWLTGAGIVLGMTGARFVAVLLHGPANYAESDIMWLVVMAVGFGGMGILASWLPARRAARVEPMVVWAKVG